MDASDFLFPRDLEVTPTDIKKILFIGSCLSETYVDEFKKIKPDLVLEHVLFNNAADLPLQSNEQLADFNLQYIQIPLRSVFGDMVVRVADNAEIDWFDVAVRNLDAMLDAALAYNRQSGLLTLVSNFIIPQGITARSLQEQYSETDLTDIVRRLNRYLGQRVQSFDHVYIANIDMLASTMGKRYFLNDIIYFYTQGSIVDPEWSEFEMHAPWAFPDLGRLEPVQALGITYENRKDEFFRSVYRQIESIYRTVNQIDSVKLVIFDLDNTMWRGLIGEHYGQGMEWPGYAGWPMGVWEAVQYLRQRGIIVSLASKNDEATVIERWEDAVRFGFAQFSDFTFPQINWNPKAENIRTIIEALSLTPKSVVFVDDNPVERESVRTQLPGIRTIGSDPFLTRRILLWAPETQIAAVTEVTAKRESMLRNQVKREVARNQLSREEFLMELGTKLHFWQVDEPTHPTFRRIFELVNKTNQFNTNGERWRLEEIHAHFAVGGTLWAFAVTDRYTDYGTVGAAFVKGTEILQFVMSCRVLGMEVETGAVSLLVKKIRQDDLTDVRGTIVETASNMPCRQLYAKAGFEAAEGGIYVLSSAQVISVPRHITVIENSGRSGEKSIFDNLPSDFDEARYYELYEDVKKSGQTAAFHYITYGMKEGRPYK